MIPETLWYVSVVDCDAYYDVVIGTSWLDVKFASVAEANDICIRLAMYFRCPAFVATARTQTEVVSVK